MKKVFLTVTLILFVVSLFCDEEVIQVTKGFQIHNINISLGVINGGSLGIGKIQQFKKSTNEITANFQYKANNDYFVTGIYGQIKSFRSKDRKGFFTLFTAGLDYTKGEEYQNPIFGIPGGPNEGDYDKKKFEGIFPNVTIGCGFSVKLSSNNRLMISLDLGLKKGFASLNVGTNF